MTEILRYALLGVGTGAVYALLAQGLVLVYRGSGLLNFAQGALAMVGAYAYYAVTVQAGLPKIVGLGAALFGCAALGAAIHLVVLRPMRRSSPLSRVIATLGVLIALQSSAFLVYGHEPRTVPGLLPTHPVHLFVHGLVLGADRCYLLVIGAVLTAVLYTVYRFTQFGRLTTAVAENEIAAASLGHSADIVASVNWAIGSALAGLAGVLIAPIIFLEPTSLVLLVLPAMSAALIGQFSSFPVTFVVSLALGCAQAEVGRYVSQPGWATAAPFVAVVVVLLFRGTGVPGRSFVLDRLPSVGTGRVRWVPVALCYAAGSAALLSTNADWATAATVTIGAAIIALSVVLITGYTGQLSLAQGVLAGVGALLAARLAQHVPFIAALGIATAVTAVAGALIAVPALRTRGTTLAIATLGLGGAVSAVALGNGRYTGGIGGILVPVPSLFGWSIDPFFRPGRYAFAAFTLLVLFAIAIANLRRGITGRRLLAIRSSERAAAAMGINNALVKTFAFMLGGSVAAAGGIVLAFQQPAVVVGQEPSFTVFACIMFVAVVVAAGVGTVPGALVGALLIPGGLVSKALSSWSQVNDYLPLSSGLVLIVTLQLSADGLVPLARRLAGRGGPVLSRGVSRRRSSGPAVSEAPRDHEQRPAEIAPPRTLEVRGISVSFGGVRAVDDVSLVVRPGEIHGLIGPNGAGKTTLIDAITGLVPMRSGQLYLGDLQISGWPTRRRATAGIARSFQSIELFADLTVAENLAVATEQASGVRWLTDLVWPSRLALTAATHEVMRQFDLTSDADASPTELSFGRRKAVAIARAVAAAPSVVLLDEPAAGLDEHEAGELSELIRRVAKEWGIGVLLVEHRMEMIMALSDRVTVLERGRVLAEGTPAEIRTHPEVLDAYLGTDRTSTPCAEAAAELA